MKIGILPAILAILICSSTVSSWAQDQPFEADIYTVGLWHFNEISGIVAGDSSGNGLHGELQNGVAWDPDGKFGGCVSFDHSGTEGQRVFVPDDPLLDISDVLTIDAWIYLRPTSDLGFIVSRWDKSSSEPKGQFILDIAATNTLRFLCANVTETFTIAVEDIPFEQWILVSAVFDNGQMAIFINEEQRAFGFAPFTTLTSGEFTHDELNIGDHWRDLNYPYTFEGKIDEVRLSNISRYLITDYTCGDANNDGSINVSDAIWIANYVFIGGPEPDPFMSGEVNCDGSLNVSDAVWIINYVFIGGNEPCDSDGDGIPDC